MPVVGSDGPAAWDWSRAVQVTGLLPAELPVWQVSVWVQALPSLHAVPSDAGGLEQIPVVGSHVPATWHWSRAVQVTGLLPMQVPLWQVSVWVQALPSSHGVPSGWEEQLEGFSGTALRCTERPLHADGRGSGLRAPRSDRV